MLTSVFELLDLCTHVWKSENVGKTHVISDLIKILITWNKLYVFLYEINMIYDTYS